MSTSKPSKSRKGIRGLFRFGSSTNASVSSVESPASSGSPPSISAQTEQPSATPQPAEVKAGNEQITNAVWIGLRASLQALKRTSAVSQLSATAGVLLECFDGIEAAARNQQDYEDLAKELTELSETLAGHDKGPMSKGISSVAIGMEQQAKEIQEKMSRGSAGRFVVAKADEEDVMRRYRHIQSLFRRLQANLSMSTWSIANQHMVNTQLESLNPVKQATYDSTLSSTVNRRKCTEGTRAQILSDLDKWAYDTTAPAVYWMNGMAGTGKTTIACTFSQQLERHEVLAASFFCTRTSADCRDVARIIPTIAYQLARYSIPFQSALHDILDKEPDAGSKNIEKQFERLLQDPLMVAKDGMPDNLVVVIDALDECDDRNGVEMMLDMLFRHASELPLKFFVTSRPEPEIYSKMGLHSKSRETVHLHEIEKSLVQADIEMYLKEELSFMSPSPLEVGQLVERSGALFIYAATLVRYIQSGKRLADPHKRLKAVLSMTPETTKHHTHIDALYTAILKSALNEDEMEEDEMEAVRTVLRTVLFVQEPVSMETLAVLAGIDSVQRVEAALIPLKSVLHLSEQTGLVSTLHASFPDFMFNNERSGTYFCDVLEHSQILAERSFLVMKEQLRFNICKLESSFVPDEQVENVQQRIQEQISPTLSYACRYWGNHLALCPKSDSLLEVLKEFICDRLLWWMEVLSLKRQTVVGIETLVKAKQWLNQAGSGSVEMALLLEDARNFVTGFASSPVSHYTPHIYISSLPLCPRSSTVYTNYWHRTRGLLELKGSLMERREGAALATWKIGSTVYSVAYSPDGSRVAVGCWDHTVRILNAHDGTPLVDPLRCPSYVHSVTFSPDGTLVASGSVDGGVCVWNACSGTLIAGPFERHTNSVYSIAFSPDGSHIVSGSSDATIRIWNTQDGTLIRGPLEGHTDTVYSVAYSPDGTLIASGSYDKTVRLWHSCDGTPAHPPFKGHTDWVRSVALTPDGTRLVSGSDDNTIRVWNISDGSLVGSPFEGHTSGVRSVAVSPDGTRVVSGSYDDTVRVWNIEDGTVVSGPFIGGSIWSVAYSPDGTRVISGSSDGTIRVWNVRDGVRPLPTPFQAHISKLKSILSVGDGAQILSSSEDDSVWAWDMSADVPTPRPTSLNYSLVPLPHLPPPTPYVLARTQDGIAIIDTNTDSVIVSPSFGRSSFFTASTFSIDNTHFAAGFGDGSVQVWDFPSARLTSGPFRGHGGAVTSLVLSLDSARVFSCSPEDKTIRVWNAQHSPLQVAPPLASAIKPSSDFDRESIVKDWQIQENGWVVNGSSHLLFCFPADLMHNHTWPSPQVEFIITKDGILHVPQQELFIGDQWSRCYLSD